MSTLSRWRLQELPETELRPIACSITDPHSVAAMRSSTIRCGSARSLLLALTRQHPHARRAAAMPRNRTGNLGPQRARRSFTPTRTPTLRGKDGTSITSAQPSQALSRGQIPIAPAAPPLRHFPRFRALALFGRRPHEHVVRPLMPASENLHNNGTRPAFIQSPRRHGRVGAGRP
jgi:hypothetical protein